MEILTIVLAGLLSLVSGGGIILDSVAANRIRDQVISIEQQKIRVDNSPSYQIAEGKLQKVRIATRGVKIKPGLRIAVLELETDQLDFDSSKLDLSNIDKLRASLELPLQGALKVVLTEADLNQVLQSPEILAQLQAALNRIILSRAGSANIAYELLDLRLELQAANHLGVQFKLRRPKSNFELNSPAATTSGNSSRELAITLKFKLQVLNGKTISITEAQGTVNGRPMSPRLLNGFAVGISDRLNLDSLQADGILARILQLEIDQDKLKLVSFVKVETKAAQLSSDKR